ncbi:MAG: hypothetical protein O9257_05885 [Brevundimonas sp.]|jgi:hypothetical protein|nr:hypothetical protein [Brevundimonas sp.]
MTPKDSIRAAARKQHYLSRDNLDLLEIDALGVREERFSIFNRNIDIQPSGAFVGLGRLRFAVTDGSGVMTGRSSCEAHFSGRLTSDGAEIHSVAVEEF